MRPKQNPFRRTGRSKRWAETEDYQRVRGNRRQRGRLFVVCEGKETEPLYFEAAWKERQKQNQLDPTIVVKPGKAKTYPTAVVERAVDIKQASSWDNELDEIWAVFDIEQAGTHPDIKQVIQLAKKHQVHLAVSNPSVEYWFLLHFENTDRPFHNADKVCEALRKYVPDYSKSKSMYILLRSRMYAALTRAQAFRNGAVHKWIDFPNPSTGLDFLIRYIFKEEK